MPPEGDGTAGRAHEASLGSLGPGGQQLPTAQRTKALELGARKNDIWGTLQSSGGAAGFQGLGSLGGVFTPVHEPAVTVEAGHPARAKRATLTLSCPPPTCAIALAQQKLAALSSLPLLSS